MMNEKKENLFTKAQKSRSQSFRSLSIHISCDKCCFSLLLGGKWILELINSVKTSKKYSNFPLLPLVVSHLYFALLLVCRPFFYSSRLIASILTLDNSTRYNTTNNIEFFFSFFKSRFFFCFSLRPPQTRGATTTTRERERVETKPRKRMNEWVEEEASKKTEK